MSEQVECFHCGKKVRLRSDGTYPMHGWTTRGVKHECERSGQVHNRHTGSFRIATRNPTRWLGECLCGESFIGETYDAVDAAWSAHRKAAV